MKPQKEITVHRKMVICGSEDLRVVWTLDSIYNAYTLEVQDFKAGWIPLCYYETKKEAVAGMDALIAASRLEMEYEEADVEAMQEVCDEEDHHRGE